MSHLAPLSEEEANRLLGMVVDVENIFMSMHREEDADTKRVYYYLFKVCPVITLSYQWPCSLFLNRAWSICSRCTAAYRPIVRP